MGTTPPRRCVGKWTLVTTIGSTARRGMAALRGIEEHGTAFRARFTSPSLEPISLGPPAPRPRAPPPEPQLVNFHDEGSRAWARAGAWAADVWASAWPRSEGDEGAGRRPPSHAQTAREEASAIDVDAALRHQAEVDDDAPPPPSWYEQLELASHAGQAGAYTRSRWSST